MIFICPICKQKLELFENKIVKCPSGHSFDRAKEGYYPLLLSSGGMHGDNAQMVEARRAFLSAGFYAPLARRVAALAAELLPPGGTVLDAGCGEGYYTSVIADALASAGSCGQVCGFDISKDAVRRAAKRDPRLHLAVAGSYHIPVADRSVDLLVDLFSPLAAEEFCRVLKSHGVFLMAIPAEDHLFELKAAVYDTPYRNSPKDPALPGFDRLATERLTFRMDLSDRAAVSALFGMTPYAYRTPADGRARVAALDRLSVTADFLLFTYRLSI